MDSDSDVVTVEKNENNKVPFFWVGKLATLVNAGKTT